MNISVANSPLKKPSRPSVLLVEPDLNLLANRALLLSRSDYTVAIANNYREIFELRGEAGFHLAVLSDTLGELALCAAAEFVRRQWPSARILILGSARVPLEDYLYDEVVDHRFQPKELLDTLSRLCEDSWSLTSRLLGCRLGTSICTTERGTSRRSIPPESDLSKAVHYKCVEEDRDAPARAQRMRRSL